MAVVADVPAPDRWRTVAGRLCVVLGVLALALGTLAGVAHREVLDGDRFAAHLDEVRTDADVSREIGVRLTDRVLEVDPDLVAVRPLLEAIATSLVASPAFSKVLRAAVKPLHDALVTGNGGDVVLRLADVGALLLAAITTIAPEVGARVPADLDVRLATFGSQEVTSELISKARTVDFLSWALPMLGLVLLAAAAMLRLEPSKSRWAPITRALGGGLLVAAAVLAALTIAVGAWVARTDADSLRDAIRVAVWHELDGPLWAAIGFVGLVGLAVRALGPGAWAALTNDPWTSLRVWLTGDRADSRARRSRGGIVAVVGLLVLMRPLAVLTVALVGLGLLLVAYGVVQFLSALPSPRSDRMRLAAHRALAGALVVVTVAAVVVAAWPATSRLPRAVAGGGTACNGHRELCDRAYDAVAYPATHNSMSAGDEAGWFLAEQPTGVIGQLDDGVRVFLIDSWYGQTTQREGVVATAEELRAAALSEAEQTYGPALLNSALRLRRALGLEPTGAVTPYLCHAICELGATTWQPLMEQVRAWLVAHPREVVTFIVQDEVSPADTAKVVEDAGLMPYVHTQSAGEPWPTLGEMIDSGRRVVFFMERQSGGTKYPWLLGAKDWIQDTPYSFTGPKQFTCAENRGPADATLFLVNHWLSNPGRRVADAARVNTRRVLGDRVEECEQERGLLPNFVAVDNYDQGDLFDVVDRLNGLSTGSLATSSSATQRP